jgi:hypothetical protein
MYVKLFEVELYGTTATIDLARETAKTIRDWGDGVRPGSYQAVLPDNPQRMNADAALERLRSAIRSELMVPDESGRIEKH